MGLFDSYYDPQTYQGGGGGLIDRLLSQLQTQGQYQPSAGYPDAQPSPLDNAQWPAGPVGAPMQANAQMQNDPIAVGNNYMMPRVGGGFPQGNANYPYSTPQEGASGPQPQPQMQQPAPMQAMAQMQPQQPAPQAPQGVPEAFLRPGGGGVGGFFRGLTENAHGGLISMALGGIAGANGQGAGDRQNAQINAQYQALLRAGVPQQQALLATINPEYGKTIIGQALGPQTLTPLGEGYVADKSGNIKRAFVPSDNYSVVKTGQDGLGREEHQVFNKSTGTLTPIKGGASSDTGGGLGNMDLTGKEYLASLPKSEANIVQQMVEGTMAPPSSFALGKPIWASRMAAAKNYDPTFDATNWSGRVAGIKDFSAGKSSEMVRSANQTLHHTGALLDSMDALKNGDYPIFNRIGNAASEATGSGAPGAFRTNAHAVATELSKVFKGSNLSDAEVHAWEQNLHENMSPEQQRTQVAKLGELLRGSLDALEEKRLNSIGPVAAEKQGPLIKEEGARVLKRIDEWVRANGKADAAAPAPLKVGESATVGGVTIKKVAH